KIVKEVIRKEKNVKFDRCYLINFGDSSLDFEVVYFVGSNDYKVFLNTKQSIMLGIYARLAKEDIGFAYPTTVVHLEKDNIG
ncbi:mechanosensitive ion channel, partial [Patescibacteria group bacterium]|nr:mechanosensitive ion channel [Patescibacteria group bacterium]